MILAVDEAIPYRHEAFAALGEVRYFSGRQLRPEDVRQADALIVRSVTRVNASLLEGSSVRFVGTATIGMDHIDQEYLAQRGIPFANAAGSNANSVSEYTIAALLLVASRRGWDLREKSLAVVGAGYVGSRLAAKAAAIGMPVRLCDPPLRDTTGNSKYLLLEDVLDADILTLHTPLTTRGDYPTYHMFHQGIFERLSARQFIINTARGSVIHETDLKRALASGKIAGAVLDVWEGEPRIDYELLDLVDLGSAHIAGFSLDGKVQGTEMILTALCGHFGLQVSWDTRKVYPQPRHIRPSYGTQGQDAIGSVVTQTYDILEDDSNLRSLTPLPTEEAGYRFDRLRNEYALRPEFRHFIVDLGAEAGELAPILENLGFQVNRA